MTEITLIEALEKLALIAKNGLDTLIQIQGNANEPITIGDAIKAIRNHAIDIYETENYAISSDGIRKVKDSGDLGDIVYQVKENA
ncbi:MAG: hypothetical protein ACYDEF_02585 [Methanosarcina sp.]|nr:hypothetical protein BGV40_07195 [Methanosarcina sp. Ant1]